ncbi:MAG: methionine aminotransferase [Cyclobacteriaceae bacterium]|nr:methionine aminotransferase [Cyclobacteriaceae bacterium]
MIDSKLPYTGTSIFTVMSALAAEHGALNLSQGFPDFPVDPDLVERINDYMKRGYNQYAPMPGVPVLKQEISRVVEESFLRKTDPNEEVIIYSGATEGLFVTLLTIINKGDEVIIFDPVYDSYDPVTRLAGGIPVHVPLQPPYFDIPWEIVERKITNRTKAIVVNTPHNPTGKLFSEEDMQKLAFLAEKNDLYVVSDEVYERIVFDGRKHESVLKYPALRKRAIAIFSFGKTFHATGWKIGYTVAVPEITSELRKVHQFVTFSVNTPIQYALADHLKNPENYLNLGAFFQAKRDRFLEGIKGTKFVPLPCGGTYFQVVSVPDMEGLSDEEYVRRMTIRDGVAAIPISVFYQDQQDHRLLRFCFAKEDETIDRATEILRRLYS